MCQARGRPAFYLRGVQRIDGRFVYSASDLNDDLECRHLSALERQTALGELLRPAVDRSAELIAAKGAEHESRQLARFAADAGPDDLAAFSPRIENTLDGMAAAEAETLAAMERGVRIISQAAFFDGTFLGRADFLRRVEKPCAKWRWSYEVVDTKLALSPKPSFLIQLCNYSEHVERLQGTAPEFAYVILGSGFERRFTLADFAAYYRHRKRTFLSELARAAETYPRQCAHCNICRWSPVCDKQREDDDYLGIVAGIRNDQIERLEGAGITTLAQLGAAGDDRRPQFMREQTFAKLRAQAALQHRQRAATAAGASQRYFYEFLEGEKTGLELLPAPDPGDVFFDMEGDPLYAPGRGLEYLFGVYLAGENRYVGFWAHDHTEERAAFEQLVDLLVERRARYPKMHVYHYAPYETTALRRLMGRFASREREIDDLLTGEVFVDLYAVVRQSLRISQPSYSIKKLEAFYGMTRSATVARGDDSIVQFEAWLASGDATILAGIERYNEEDCRSTYLLREWLNERREELAVRKGAPLAWRPEPEPREAEVDERPELARQLLDGLPDFELLRELREAGERTRGRWLLGHALEYHRREEKPAWWKIFDRCDNVDLLEEFDREAIGGLHLRPDIVAYKLRPRDSLLVHTYEFPDQQHNLGRGRPWCPRAREDAGEVVEIDNERNLLRLKVAGKRIAKDIHALIPGPPVRAPEQKAALRRLAQAYLDGTLAERFPATHDLLLAATPRLFNRLPGLPIQPASVDAAEISRVVAELDGSYLVIQGPPGTGKSTKGAAVIVDLLRAGKRVGILARGYKAIHNLLHKIEEEAEARGHRFNGKLKHSTTTEGSPYESRLAAPMIVNEANHEAFLEPHDLAAGTPWFFARGEQIDAYDYLIVDEAGQLALGDVLACAPAARNVVLLGDPLQLAQVSTGSHPLGSDLSILEHLLGDDVTVRPERGIFLDRSFRMHPEICRFVSQAVYEGRLHAAETARGNRVDSAGLNGSGLRYLQVVHSGNTRASLEEAEAIVCEVRALLGGEVTAGGKPGRRFERDDVLVVTPYNAQRKLIQERLTAAGYPEIRVGTVDKFQGQEAPVVFYSMATSSGEDLPRDMAFLFEQNRLNVAISRAQCVTVLICSPRLLDVSCSSPEQMALANLLCRYVEECAGESPRAVALSA